MDPAQEITFLSFVAFSVPMGISITALRRRTQAAWQSRAREMQSQETLPLSWDVEKIFAAKPRLNDSKCRSGILGVKGGEDLTFLGHQWCPDIAAEVIREMGMTCGPPCAWCAHCRLMLGLF